MIISIFGRTGQGKTILSRMLAKEISQINQCKVFEYSPFEKTDYPEFYDFKTNSIYIINEMQVFSSLFRKKDPLIKVVTGHRHYNISFILNSQRPALIDRIFTALSHKIFVFNIIENIDLQYLRVMSNTSMDDIRNLKVFEFFDIFSNKKFFIDINKKMVYSADMKGDV